MALFPFILAHSDMFLSVETFKEQYRYLNTLWQGLSEMYRQGMTLEAAKEKYTIKKDFSYFMDKITKMGDIDINEHNIEALWEKISDKTI